MIYKPREDSFLLEGEVKKRARDKKVLDVGTGSGIQMEAALESGADYVKGIDLDKESVVFCKNKKLKVVRADLFSKEHKKYDLIIFNPPYLPGDEREDEESSRATSGGVKGDEIIVRFLGDVGKYLEEDGIILLVVSSLTPPDEIEKIMKEKGFGKKVVASEKVFMEELWVWEIRRHQE